MGRRRGWMVAGVGIIAVILFGLAEIWPRPVAGVHEGGAVSRVPVRTAPEAEPNGVPEAPPEELVVYDGPVEHIFFHPLIIYPQLAFDGDGLSRGYDDWFVTVPEFRKMIESLYARGFVLVDYRTLFPDGNLTRKPLLLPKGKKPLLLSIDDLNYYQYMRANGNAHKLILDETGQLRTVSQKPDGTPVISGDDEIITILDAFVAAHPDFSFRGAKGVIALTGYEGILGYRTDQRSVPGYAAEKAAAQRVVDRLKAEGWTFASHGWGHLDARKISADTLARDTQRWLDEVGALLGPTPVYIYPFGASLSPNDPKLRILQQAGFQIFCGVGPDPALVTGKGYVMQDRRHIDGMALRTQQRSLQPFFDAAAILDPVRPKRP